MRIDDLDVTVELAQEADDADLHAEAVEELSSIKKVFKPA